MPYRNQPITIEDGAWVGAQAFVAPGVTIRTEAVMTAGSVVTKNQPAGTVCGGNPSVPLRLRWPAQRGPADAELPARATVETT
jgi:putative colanic acid biosynthesis acetyltransferase WcaF